jgi:hypothetical protein
MEIFVRSIAFSALLAALVGLPAAASAQTSVAIYRGTSEYDLSDVDRAATTAIRVTRELSSLFAIEGGASYVELRQDFGQTKVYMPEALLQLQLPIGRFAPYIGVGAGLGIDVPNDSDLRTETDPTFLAAAGVRINLPYNLMLGADGRLRGFETRFTGAGAEASIGLGYRF